MFVTLAAAAIAQPAVALAAPTVAEIATAATVHSSCLATPLCAV